MNSKKITLGILNADELAPEVEEEFGNYSDMFQRLFEKNTLPFNFKSYQVTQENYPLTIDECDAYLVTGSKFNVYENIPWIIKLEEFIQQLSKNNKKLIGICFGHQIIAQALGGQVTKSNNGWGVGLMSSTVIKNQTWMNPAHNSISLLGIHQDQVIELPKDAVRLTESNFCPNSSFQIGKTILTFQGHPEFSKDYLLQMMDNRREVLGEKTYQSGLKSLAQAADESIIAHWIANFLK